MNIAAVLWLLLCKLASTYDTSAQPSVISLLSFSCLFAILANVVFVFIWLFSRRKLRFFISLIALAVCWPMVRQVIGLNYFGNNKVKPNDGGLKVMSWNVHMFDLGEWTQDETSRRKMLDLIQDENPDVLCLQEFYWDVDQALEPYTSLIQQLGYPYVKLSSEAVLNKSRMTVHAQKNEKIALGNAIFSKYPLQNEIMYDLAGTGGSYKLLSADLLLDSLNTFNINVVHLTSVGFGTKEFDYIEEVKAKGVKVENKRRSKRLLKKLIVAASERDQLANRIDSIKRFTEYPIILCGDFNDIPGSYAYKKVKGELTDAFERKGAGLGRTYRHIFPTLRIDYIMFDESALKVEGYLRKNVGLSDHFPIIANFSLRPKKPDSNK